MYNENDGKLMMSSIGQNTNFSYLQFYFDTEITRVDIDLAIYEDSQLDLTKGKYRIRAYWINEENVIEYLTSLVEDNPNFKSKELPIGVDSIEKVTVYFDRPINNLMIRYEYLGSNPTSLCKIAVGDIDFYKGQLPNEYNPLPLSGYELPYEPEKWNDYTMEFYNCYCYALNTKYYGWLCPGWLSDEDYYLPFNKTNLVYCIKQDFIKYNEYRNSNMIFIPVSRYETCPIGTYKIALVVDNYNYSGDLNNPDYDVHFYRQNEDGSWSHKPGIHEVTNLDGSLNKIFDPETCDRQNIYYEELNYSIFFGYYAVSAWG